MLVFSQRVIILFELSQKGVLAPWLTNDNNVFGFLETVEFEALAERNIRDFINIGQILSSRQLTNYVNEPSKLQSLISKFQDVLKLQTASLNESVEQNNS